MRQLRPVIVFASFFLLAPLVAPHASAQQDVGITGVGDGVVVNGVYVGHYNMATPGSPSLDVFCIDFLNAVRVGDKWSAHFSGMNGSLANTRHGDAALDLYKRAAWLSTQFSAHASSEWGAIHAAIWYTMAPNPETVTRLQQANWYNWEVGETTVAHWIEMADTHYGQVDPAQFTVITDVEGVGTVQGGKQEFITVSEPLTILLLMTGLLGVLWVARTRRRRTEELAGGDLGGGLA